MTLIDTETAALILQVTPRQVRNTVAAGRLTNYGTRRRIKIDLEQAVRLKRLYGSYLWVTDYVEFTGEALRKETRPPDHLGT